MSALVERRIREADLHFHRMGELERTVDRFVTVQEELRKAEERQYRRLEVRMQLLTAVLALCGVVVPIIVLALHPH